MSSSNNPVLAYSLCLRVESTLSENKLSTAAEKVLHSIEEYFEDKFRDVNKFASQKPTTKYIVEVFISVLL